MKSGPIVGVLAFQGMFRCLAGTAGSLFQGLGRPWLQTAVAASELMAAAVALVPLFRHGMVGVAAALAVGGAVAMVVALALVTRLVRLGTADLARVFGAPAFGLLAVLALRASLPPGFPETAIGLAGLLAVSVALCAAIVLGSMRLGAYSLDPEIRAAVGRWLLGLA